MTYDEAQKEIAAGRAKARSLWLLLSDEHDRDGYALRPEKWEGPGEYQCVVRADETLGVLVRITGHPALKTR